MDKVSFAAEIDAWIAGDPAREDFLIKEAPIAESTLRQTIAGRYIPGPRLEKLVRNAMEKLPAKAKAAVAV